MPTVWERIVFQLARAFWLAYFEAKLASQEAAEEVPDEKARARALRFRAAVKRLREALSDPRPDRAASGGEGV